MTAVLGWAAEEGVGVGIAANFGNRADVTESDFLQYLDEVEEVKTVALYLEGFRWRGDAARFLASARRMKKPVVVYKAARGPTPREPPLLTRRLWRGATRCIKRFLDRQESWR